MHWAVLNLMFNSDKAPGEEESSRTDPTYSIKQPAKEGYFSGR